MEKLIKSDNGQWTLVKAAPKGVDKDRWDRCVEDVKAEGKVESPHAVCTASMTKEEDNDSEMMFSQLEAIMHHIKEIREAMSPKEDAPDWVDAKITEAAKQLSDVAHYIQGVKAAKK
jgi:hypothetical protein